MKDRYMTLSENIERLIRSYKKHQNLVIAFDFDDTVFDYHDNGDTYPEIEQILWRAKEAGLTLILFTCREGDMLQWAKHYCKEKGYEPDFVNMNPIMHTTKPYYNILLDDKAGLFTAHYILNETLNQLGL